MDKEGKSATSISLRHRTHLFIKERNINLSAEIEEWLENKYMNNQTILERLLKDREELEKRIEAIKLKIEEDRIKSQEEVNNLSELELRELTESLDVLRSKGDNFLIPRRDRYNTLCEKNITLEKFKWLLERVRSKINNK